MDIIIFLFLYLFVCLFQINMRLLILLPFGLTFFNSVVPLFICCCKSFSIEVKELLKKNETRGNDFAISFSIQVDFALELTEMKRRIWFDDKGILLFKLIHKMKSNYRREKKENTKN